MIGKHNSEGGGKCQKIVGGKKGTRKRGPYEEYVQGITWYRGGW